MKYCLVGGVGARPLPGYSYITSGNRRNNQYQPRLSGANSIPPNSRQISSSQEHPTKVHSIVYTAYISNRRIPLVHPRRSQTFVSSRSMQQHSMKMHSMDHTIARSDPSPIIHPRRSLLNPHQNPFNNLQQIYTYKQNIHQ